MFVSVVGKDFFETTKTEKRLPVVLQFKIEKWTACNTAVVENVIRRHDNTGGKGRAYCSTSRRTPKKGCT
jgi:hypothetical protein